MSSIKHSDKICPGSIGSSSTSFSCFSQVITLFVLLQTQKFLSIAKLFNKLDGVPIIRLSKAVRLEKNSKMAPTDDAREQTFRICSGRKLNFLVLWVNRDVMCV